MLLGLWACGPRGPEAAEPFARDRVSQLASTLRTARDAQAIASQDLLQGLDDSTDPALAGLSTDAAYERTRRALLRSESRVSTAVQRLNAAETRGTDQFEEWDRELGRYEDPDLRHAAEANIAAMQGRHRAAVKHLRAAIESMAPLRRALADRVRFLDHNRDHAAVPSVETSEASRVREAAARTELGRRLAEADAAVEAFSSAIRPRPRAQENAPASGGGVSR